MKRLFIFQIFFISTFSFYSQTTFSCTTPGTLCPCTSGSRGEYYSGYFNDVQTYFTSNTPGLSRVEGTINYTTNNWGAIVPPAGGSTANPDNYSTRFSGRIFLAAGTYTFWLTSDDASFLWLGPNALVVNPTTAAAFINNGGLHSPATVAAVAILSSDCLIDFKIHFGENGGDNYAILEYASTGLSIARQVVPNGALCSCMSSGPLPVELTNFAAQLRDGKVVLKWTTASEKNSKSFTMHKSADGINWSVLDEQAAAGTSKTRNDYSITDAQPNAGLNYYYLSQTDEDGSIKKFSTISFDYNNSDNEVKVFPNPFQEKFTIVCSSEIKDLGTITLHNELGNALDIVFDKIDRYTLEFNTSTLPSGSYSLKIKTRNGFLVKRIMKN